MEKPDTNMVIGYLTRYETPHVGVCDKIN